MWYEIDIRKLFYIEFFLMKKIIILIFVLVWFVGFGFACQNNNDCLWSETCKITPPLLIWVCEKKVCSANADCLISEICDIKIPMNTWYCIINKNYCPPEREYNNWCCPIWAIPYNDNKKCCDWLLYDNGKQCCEKWKTILSDGSKESCISCDVIAKEDADKLDDKKKNNCLLSSCDDSKKYQLENWFTVCCPWMVVNDTKNPWQKTCIINTEWNLGINMNSDCLINWQCSYNIYKTLGIRKSDQNPKVSTFVQDIVLWVTMFLWTVISLILIISGILYILAAILGKSNLADMAKKWIFNSILWLVLVSWSYAIVRLVQFVATAGGW